MSSNNLKDIAKGFKNLIVSKKEIEDLSAKRTKVCLSCDDYRKVSNTCGICHCFIPAKTRCIECACPKEHW